MRTEQMDKLRSILHNRPGPSVAIIVDNMNLIFKYASDFKRIPVRYHESIQYFATNWLNWKSQNSCFVRMDFGTAETYREFELSADDQTRLRFLRPWSRGVARAAISHPLSPIHVNRSLAHDRIHYICGGLIGKLLQCGKYLPAGPVIPQTLDQMEHKMTESMFCLGGFSGHCYYWLHKLKTEDERTQIARDVIAKLMQGTALFRDTKGAYDASLVTLDDFNKFVRPTSALAGSIMHQHMSKILKTKRVSFLNISEHDELSTQMHACLDQCRGFLDIFVTLKRLDGTPVQPNIRIETFQALSFHEPLNTKPADTRSILYVPDRPNYLCDAIIVPSRFLDQDRVGYRIYEHDLTWKQTKPVLVLEWSLLDPRDPVRMAKIKNWFVAGGLINSIKSVNPEREVTILLCWTGQFDAEKMPKKQCVELDTLAQHHGVGLFVVDGDSLNGLYPSSAQ
jgi:hypothetical protein